MEAERIHTPIPIEHIELFADIARILREKNPGKRTVLEVMEIIARVVDFDSATLFLMNNRKDKLDEIASRGKTVNIVGFLEFDQGPGLAAWAAKQKRPVHIPGRDPSVTGVRQHHDSVLLYPLLVSDELIGVLCFSHPDPDAFDETCQRFLEVVSSQFAFSLERILLVRDVDSLQTRLGRAEQSARAVERQESEDGRLQEIRRLAAEINREINEPLAAIVGSAKIIELESGDLPLQVRERVGTIVDGARQISLITHKLQIIERLVAGQLAGDENRNVSEANKPTGDL